MGTRVRRILPGEGQLLRDVRLAALADAPHAFASRFEGESQLPAGAWETFATERSAGRETTNFFIESDDSVLGLVGAYRNGGQPETVDLVSMWVTPRARGQGAGAQLVRSVVEWAEEGGARRVALWVMRTNDPARSLYERTGFVAVDVTSDLATHPCHAEIRMVRELP